MSASKTTSEVVVEAIASSGARSIFAYPGDPIVDIMEQARAGGLDVVLARREASSAFMAEAAAMAGGGVGVCLSTLGPGSTALLNGVAAATLDRVPVLAISGQIETAREQYFTHQVIDHKLLYSPVTKWAGRIEPSSIGLVMRKALSLATAERPGAVHLTIPGDLSSRPAEDTSFTVPPRPSAIAPPRILRPDGEDRSEPIHLLHAARRPVILTGISAMRAGATPQLERIAETMSAPVVVAPMAKGVFREDHPLFAGVLDMACNEILWSFLGDADLIVAVGFDPVELIKPWTATAPVLHIDSVPNTDQIYASACECVGDIAGILDWLADEWTGQPRWSESAVFAHRKTLANAYYAGRVDGAVNPTDVVDVVRSAFPEDTIATSDVGSHKLLIGQGWKAYRPRSVLMTNGLSSMGFGIPAAIGAKIVRPDVPVVAMVGDGGFAMAAMEIRLAASLNLPITFVVFVDGSLNRIELKQMAAGFASTATRIEDVDIVALAGALHCDGVRADSIASLDRALEGAATRTRPLIVEARVDPTQYASQF